MQLIRMEAKMSSQKWCFGCDCNMSHPKAESSTLSLVTTHSCTACRTQRSVETRCWTVSRLMLLWSIFSLSPSTSCAHFRCSRLKTQLRSPDPGSAGRNPCSVSAARWRPCCGSNVQRWNKSCQRPLSHTRHQDLSAWSQQCTCCETVFLVGKGGCRQATRPPHRQARSQDWFGWVLSHTATSKSIFALSRATFPQLRATSL